MLIRSDASSNKRVGREIQYGHRVLLLALASGVPGVAASLILLWVFADLSVETRWVMTAVIVAAWLYLGFLVRRKIVFPLQTVSNLVAALREGDFSVRGRDLRSGDTLEELIREVNALSETLHEQRLGAVEATALLRKVMEEIDVAVFAFDSGGRLRLLNRAAERLLGITTERALNQDVQRLGLANYVQNGAPRLFDAVFPGGAGRWEIRRSEFRQGGKPHQLLVLSDLTRTLREEELQAWQRIVRVIGHELNNSLAPIKSISTSLQTQLGRPDRPEDWEEDLTRGLAVISSRSESLARLMTSYARLARLPKPKLQAVDLSAIVSRTCGLETRVPVRIEPGPAVEIQADPDQMEQVLINLIRNAADASLETGGNVYVTWRCSPGNVEMCVTDDGPGLASTANLFVPFFTTKPAGSGIGLVLSRQIAEAHNGSLTLENRQGASGCVATFRLPTRL